MDSWVNSLTGLGGSRDKTIANAFNLIQLRQPSELEFLYHGDDLAARIVDAPIKHAMMQGFDIGQDEDGSIEQAVRRWDIGRKVTDAAIWGRCYGGGAVLMGVNRGRMDEPLELDAIMPGDLKFLMTLDRRDLFVEDYYDDPEQENFGEPRTYRIAKAVGNSSQALLGEPVHESRLVLFGGVLTSERLRQANGGWDMSALQRPYDVLRDTNTNWRSVVHVMADLSQAVFKMKGLVDMIAEGEGAIMQDRMEIVNMARSVARAVLVDADSEEFQQVGAANIAGVGDLLEKTWQRLAAAAEMPVTVLMGMSPSGMNATGDSDMRSWFNTIRVHQEHVLGPALQQLVVVVARAEGVVLDEQPTVQWPSLWQMSPTEDADHRNKVASTDKIYIDSGVLLPEEVTIARFGRGQYSDETAQAVEVDSRESALAAKLRGDDMTQQEQTQEPDPAPPGEQPSE